MIKIPDFFEQKRYQDNPNPNAKIGFVLFYPFQFYVQKNVYKHLKEEAEFIVDLGAFFPVEQPEDLINDIISLLKKHNVYYRILYYDDYFYTSYLEDFFSQYEALVSLWVRGCVKLRCNINRKKVHLTYGAGKELITFSLFKRVFDLILAYGSYDHKHFSLYTQSEIVGNPKFDDWFNNEFDEELLNTLKNKLNQNKKTVLYLPTHSDLCSIDDLASQIKKITKDYNVIVKLHYYTPREEPERVKKLQHPNIILLKDDADLLTLLKMSDVVLSDNSSAIFDAILADKPLVVTDFLSKEFLDVEHKRIKQLRRGWAGALTYSGSIEQKIKKEGLVISFKKPKELDSAIEKALQDPIFYKEARKKLRDELFAFQDGGCGQRAAKAIKDLLLLKELPERPILYHALEAFENEVRERSLSQKKQDARKIENYENFLLKKIKSENKKKIIFSVIVIDEENDEKLFTMSLRSLYEQKFPTENYEIIINKENLELGNFIKNSIKQAKGEFICFISGNCIAPYDWLLNFYITYQKYPDIAGVGGYVKKFSQNYTIFDEYYYLELGKKLGIQKEKYYLNKLYEIKNGLLYQNPAGSLANMSYKKEVLENLNINYQAPFLEILEMEFKKEVLKNSYELCFIPSPAINLEKMTFKKFIQKNFREGLAFYVFYLNNPQFKKYYNYNILSVIRIPFLNILEGYLKIKVLFIYFIGSLFRYLGRWNGILIKSFFSLRLSSLTQDTFSKQ